MTNAKQAHLEAARSIKTELLAGLDGMDYCLDWKQEPDEWSARELVYHILDSPPGGVHTLIKGILSKEILEYEIWSDLTNVTPERAEYNMPQIIADIESLFQGLDDTLSASSDDDLNTATAMMHHKTRGIDEERSASSILERSLDGHMRDHLSQLQSLRDALAI